MLSFIQFIRENELPTIRTTGLSSNQKNSNNVIKTVGLSSNLKEENDRGLHGRLTKHYDHSTLSEKQHNHLYDLTNSSHHINESLHNGKIPKKHQEAIKHIDEILHKHKTPEDFHVFTGMHHQMKPGLYNHKSYLHTSLSHSKAKEFAIHHGNPSERHVLKIHIPKGHHGSYVDNISINKGEKEFILPRESKLKIHPNPEKKKEASENGYSITTHTHHATIEK